MLKMISKYKTFKKVYIWGKKSDKVLDKSLICSKQSDMIVFLRHFHVYPWQRYCSKYTAFSLFPVSQFAVGFGP